MKNPLRIAGVALAAAAAAWLLPAADAGLPGGSIVWQVLAVALALFTALGVWSRGAGAARLVAAVALIGALAWLGGIAFLWLIWPR